MSIGIPGSDVYKSERFAEANIPANRIFTLNVGAGGGTQYQYYGCDSAVSWTPSAGEDYEAVFDYGAGVCRLTVSTVTQSGGGAVIKTPVAANWLKSCKN